MPASELPSIHPTELPLPPDLEFLRLWRQGEAADVWDFLAQAGPLPLDQVVAVLAADQQQRWQRGQHPWAEAYLQKCPALARRQGHAAAALLRLGDEAPVWPLLKHTATPDVARFAANSGGRAWPVGQKRPNDFGLFDLHGNSYCWCHDIANLYRPGRKGEPATDSENIKDIYINVSRMLLGRAFVYPREVLRSASRNFHRPDICINDFGFRVARTWSLR
jgi:formylglycine-generating enzyme required for sulfatase activity